MSDSDSPPPEDADRPLAEDDLDPEAPTDSPLVNPPRDDADRPADLPDDIDATDDLQAENAGTSLDQPSDQSS